MILYCPEVVTPSVIVKEVGGGGTDSADLISLGSLGYFLGRSSLDWIGGGRRRERRSFFALKLLQVGHS